MLLLVLGASAPILAALATIAALIINRRITARGSDRQDFDSIVIAYKGLYELANERVEALEAEIKALRKVVHEVQTENRKLRREVEQHRQSTMESD